MSSRLSLALAEGGLVLPESGTIAVFHPRAGDDVSALPRDRLQVIQPFFPDHAAFLAAGYDCRVDAGANRYAAVVVFLPRAKAQARALIAQAMALGDGVVVIDGAKGDGVDSVLKDMRNRCPVSAPISKAHGKLFWAQPAPEAFADWQTKDGGLADGFHTAPGVFSADGIDPASRMLADSLPRKMGRNLADLGGGWGYLSSRLLVADRIETLDLVEADHIALDCARRNVTDPRARFHWGDALSWQPEGRIDTVVMNPPFHTSRAAEPSLGRDFIRAAARILATSGDLWMVANRHLAYETTLRECFSTVEEVAGDNRFKILHGARPARLRG